MLARTERLDPNRLDRAFEATHTTSPTGSILASIDAARALLARDGERLCGRLLAGVAAARKRLAEVPGLRCPGPDGRYAQFWPHRHGTDAIFLALLRRRADAGPAS